jgi:co-chaperonin GroES (HSP10)
MMKEKFNTEISLISAVGNRVLVKLVEFEKKKGLLIVPDEKKEYQIGQVLSYGADTCENGGEISIGGYVFTRKYAGLLVEYAGQELVSLDFSEILAFSMDLGNEAP